MASSSDDTDDSIEQYVRDALKATGTSAPRSERPARFTSAEPPVRAVEPPPATAPSRGARPSPSTAPPPSPSTTPPSRGPMPSLLAMSIRTPGAPAEPSSPVPPAPIDDARSAAAAAETRARLAHLFETPASGNLIEALDAPEPVVPVPSKPRFKAVFLYAPGTPEAYASPHPPGPPPADEPAYEPAPAPAGADERRQHRTLTGHDPAPARVARVVASPVVRPELPGLVIEEATEMSGPPVAPDAEREDTEAGLVAALAAAADEAATGLHARADDDHTDAEAPAIVDDL